MKPLAIWLGSTDTILPYTMDYMGIILIGAPFIMSSFVLNNQLRYQGSANYAMVAIVIGAIIGGAVFFTVYWIKRSKKKEQELRISKSNTTKCLDIILR